MNANPEGGVRKARELDGLERAQLRIAADTLRMPAAMRGVMGGPTVEQARATMRELTGQDPDEYVRAPRLEPAQFTTNCRGCAAPIRAGEPAVRSPRTGALRCATCAQAERRPAASDDPRGEGA